MPRALIINDYSLEKSWADARAQASPFHFLYGVEYLADHGFDVKLATEPEFRLLARLDSALRRNPFPLGSLDRQASALRFLREADVIYAPCQTQTQLLTYLRGLGLLETPIVTLAHHPLQVGRLTAARRPLLKLMLRGLSAFPALSARVADEINALAPERPIGKALQWGPDEHFYPRPEYPGVGVLAAGRTQRDFVTFGRAATKSGANAQIVCLQSETTPEYSTFSANVKVHAQREFMEYRKITQWFAQSRALAVPMNRVNGLCGLTSLLDALAAGKPVIITRNAYIDLDVEALGIGRWVEPGDVEGWADALRFFDENPDRATEMGRRARALVDEGLNLRTFSRSIAELIESSLRN